MLPNAIYIYIHTRPSLHNICVNIYAYLYTYAFALFRAEHTLSDVLFTDD